MAFNKEKMEVTVSYRYKHSQQAVFEAIAAGRLFLTCGSRGDAFSNEFKVGGRWSFGWGQTNTVEGTFLEIKPFDLIRFSWSEGGEVSIRLAREGNFTVLHLTHSKLTDVDYAHDFHQGWTEVLALFTDELDGTTLRLQQDFKVSAETLFAAIGQGVLFQHNGAKPGTLQLDFKVGGEFSFEASGDDSVRGRFEKIDPHRQIVFKWIANANGESSGETTVYIYLIQLTDHSSRLHLFHDGFVNSNVSRSHLQGWTDDLKSFANSLK